MLSPSSAAPIILAFLMSASPVSAAELVAKLSGLVQPTDIQFLPGSDDQAAVLEKGGKAKLWNLKTGKASELFSVKVLTRSEEGLLGLAFHPKFSSNGRFFINFVAKVGTKDVTHIDEWIWPKQKTQPKFVRTVLTQEQPYPNHNAGQLTFGPDGYLYVGFGDGGSANDPLRAGQDLKTWLGKMLRIDVDVVGKPYGVPKDNPFVGRNDVRPEIWAYGLRNPWRYSFDSRGRLFVGDVGQNAYEEISIVSAGKNYGWSVMEAEHCFHKKDCDKKNLELPILSYDRKDGVSVTGGFVYEGKKLAALRGKYVFADFGSGKIWSTTPPDGVSVRKTSHTKELLKDCSCSPVAFGQDHSGELYVADFAGGTIFAIH